MTINKKGVVSVIKELDSKSSESRSSGRSRYSMDLEKTEKRLAGQMKLLGLNDSSESDPFKRNSVPASLNTDDDPTPKIYTPIGEVLLVKPKPQINTIEV